MCRAGTPANGVVVVQSAVLLFHMHGHRLAPIYSLHEIAQIFGPVTSNRSIEMVCLCVLI